MDDNRYRTDDYGYDLPEELIAQSPAKERDKSRLMVVSRRTGTVGHEVFADITRFLRAGDMLVMNDTRVFKARLAGRKLPGGARVEIFALSPFSRAGEWRAMVRPGRKLGDGSRVELLDGSIVTVGERLADGLRVVRLPEEDAGALFERCGEMPLPPYVKSKPEDPERYQTVYGRAGNERSAAAPTAGLHFTRELLEVLEAAGIDREFVSLDVGLGTFRPVKTDDLRDHRMHSERCRVSEAAAERISRRRREGGRIVAVGTTAVRTLESLAAPDGRVEPGEADTDVFIYPGYTFKAVDALITNFHLPRSTLLMLVSAFAGHGLVMSAYAEAVREKYRFFSFGDAMLIL